MVEVKSNKTKEELLQGVKCVLKEAHQIYPITNEGYIMVGEHELKCISKNNQKLHDAIMRLGNFGKLILGYIHCVSFDLFDYYFEFHEKLVSQGKHWLGSHYVTTTSKIPIPQGDLDFKIIESDLDKLPSIDTDILKRLSIEDIFSENSHDIFENIIKHFGNDLGMKLVGLISFSMYQGIIENFEAKANDNPDYKAFRAMVHKYPRPEPFDEKEVQCYCYHDDTKTEEEKEFVIFAMKIFKCKAMALYNNITSRPTLTSHVEQDNLCDIDFSDILLIPYIGYFDSLTSTFAQETLNEQIKDLNVVYRRFIGNVYDTFKKYIDSIKEKQISSEKSLIMQASDIIKKTFDACSTVEEKIALARAYAFDKKSELVPNGKSLLAILGIKGKKQKEMTDEERLLYHYILSLYYTRPVLRYIVSEPVMGRFSSGNRYYIGDKLTFMTTSDTSQYGYIKYSCNSYMYSAIQHRKKFEKLAKKMGLVLRQPDDVKTLNIKTDPNGPLVEPILIAKYIENEGGVVGRVSVDGSYETITPAQVLQNGGYANFIGEYHPPVKDDSDGSIEGDYGMGML